MMPAPTITELKAGTLDGTLDGLIQFLLQLPLSHEAAIFYALFLIAMPIGMFASWWAKYAITKSVDQGLLDYFFRSEVRRTMGTIGAYVGAMITAITTGVFDNDTIFVGWYNVMWMGISTAGMLDGGINKGTQGLWSEEQRDKERAKFADKAPPAV